MKINIKDGKITLISEGAAEIAQLRLIAGDLQERKIRFEYDFNCDGEVVFSLDLQK